MLVRSIVVIMIVKKYLGAINARASIDRSPFVLGGFRFPSHFSWSTFFPWLVVDLNNWILLMSADINDRFAFKLICSFISHTEQLTIACHCLLSARRRSLFVVHFITSVRRGSSAVNLEHQIGRCFFKQHNTTRALFAIESVSNNRAMCSIDKSQFERFPRWLELFSAINSKWSSGRRSKVCLRIRTQHRSTSASNAL